MSMSKLGEEFLKIPKLDSAGRDWPLWKGRLELSLSVRGLSGHLDGMAQKPNNPADGQPAGWSPSSADELKQMKTYEKEFKEWHEGDNIVKQQIAVLIPDNLFVKLLSKSTAKEYYDTLKGRFEHRSLAVAVELRRKLGEMKLKDGGDAREHINKIDILREELASASKPISEEDLFNIVFVSLPRSYNGILTSISTSIELYHQTVTCDDLMRLILNEYDRLTLQNGGKSKKDKDAAFSAAGKGKGGERESRLPLVCFNCGWEGHRKMKCWEEGGGQEGKAPDWWKPCGKKESSTKDEKVKPKVDSTKAVAVVDDMEPDGIWLTIAVHAGDIDDWLSVSEEVEDRRDIKNLEDLDDWWIDRR